MPVKHPKHCAEEFVKSMHALMDHGQRRAWDVFSDFCEMAYCALAQRTHADNKRREWLEGRYMSRVKKYTKEQAQSIADMMAMTALAIDANGEDFLGHIYEKEGFCDQKFGGQFFTPWELGRAMARLTFKNVRKIRAPVITLSEPCCGSGRLVLACTEYMRELKIDPARRIWVDAVDSDIVCAQMTYIQMTFAGVPGIVRHGNSLHLTQQDAAVTAPGVLLLNDSKYLRDWYNGKKRSSFPLLTGTSKGKAWRLRRRPSRRRRR